VRSDVLLCYLRVHWTLFIVKDSTVKYPWFDRELQNVDNNKTKAHKYFKKIETIHYRPMSESDQLYDTAIPRYRELSRDFKSFNDAY
jgi:hypothetical protein